MLFCIDSSKLMITYFFLFDATRLLILLTGDTTCEKAQLCWAGFSQSTPISSKLTTYQTYKLKELTSTVAVNDFEVVLLAMKNLKMPKLTGFPFQSIAGGNLGSAWGKQSAQNESAALKTAAQPNCSETVNAWPRVTSLGWTGCDRVRLRVGLRCQ